MQIAIDLMMAVVLMFVGIAAFYYLVKALGFCLDRSYKKAPHPKDLQEGLNEIYMKAYGDL